MFQNPYNTQAIVSNKETIKDVYLKLLINVKRLITIDKSKTRNKLPLPLLKEKYELTSKTLEALHLLNTTIDNSKEGLELQDIINDIGLNISKGNDDPYYYIISKVILESFLMD